MEVEGEFCEADPMPSTSKYLDPKPLESLSLQLEGKITNFSPTASFLPPEQTFIDPPTDNGSPKMIESFMDRKFAESKVAISSWGMQSFQGSRYDTTTGLAKKEEILQAWQTSNTPSKLQSNVTGPREVSLVSHVQANVGLDEGFATKQERKDSEIKARIHKQYIAAQEHIKRQNMIFNNSEGNNDENSSSRADKCHNSMSAAIDGTESTMAAISNQRSRGPITTVEHSDTDLNQGANNEQINNNETCLNIKSDQLQRLSDPLPPTQLAESQVKVAKACENISVNEVQTCSVVGESKCDTGDKELDSIDASQGENSAKAGEETINTNPMKATGEIAECHVSRAGNVVAQESVINIGAKPKESDCKGNASFNSLQEEVITMNETDNCISFEEFKKKREKLAITERLQVEKGIVEGKSEVSEGLEMSVDEENDNTADDTLEEHDIYAMLEEAVDKEECYAKKKQGAASLAEEAKKEGVPAISKEARKEVLELLQKDRKEEIVSSLAVKQESCSAGVETEKDRASGSEKNDEKESVKQDSVTGTPVEQQCERIGTARTEMEQDKPDSGVDKTNIREKDDTDSVLQKPNGFAGVQKELLTDGDEKDKNSNDTPEDKTFGKVRESTPEGNAICCTDAEVNKEDLEAVLTPEAMKENIVDRELRYDPISSITSNADTAKSPVELSERHEENFDHGIQEGNVDSATKSVVEGKNEDNITSAIEADVVSQASRDGDSKKEESPSFVSEGKSNLTSGVDLQQGVGQRRVKRRKRLISESDGGDGKESKAARISDPTAINEDKLKRVTTDENTTEGNRPTKQIVLPKKVETIKSDSQPSSDCDMSDDDCSVAEQEKQNSMAAAENAKPKKGRGRPKKAESSKSDFQPTLDCGIADDDTSEQGKQSSGAADEDGKPKRGRGRPKGTNSAKSDSQPSSDCDMPDDDPNEQEKQSSRATAEEVKPKRGRGRPKATKNTQPDSLPASDGDVLDDACAAQQEKQKSVAPDEEAKPKRGRGRPKTANTTKSDSLTSSDSELPHDDQETSQRRRSRSKRADDFDIVRGIDRQRSVGSESNASDTCVEGKDVETRRTRRQIRPKRCYSPSDSK